MSNSADHNTVTEPTEPSDPTRNSGAHQRQELSRENERLKRRIARKRAIIDGIAEGVAVAGKDGRLELFNPAATSIMGIEAVENGKEEWATIYGLYLPDQSTPCPTDQLPLVRAIRGEHVEGMQLVVRRPNQDAVIYLSVSASPCYDYDGQIDGGVAIFQDVTERIRADQLLAETRKQLELRVKELKASEEKYQDLYENAPDMYVTVDAQTGEIVECNQTLALATGFSKSEIVGSSMVSLHDPSCMDSVTAAIAVFRQTGRFPNDHYQLRCKDGTLIDVSVNMSAVKDSLGQIIRGRCVWRDITQFKRAEEALSRHKDELAHLTRVHTAGEMATGLAHELNQPLNAIVNYTRGFVRRATVGTIVTPELHLAAQATISQAERAAEIIAGLRRLVAKQTPARTRSDINEIVREAILMCRGESTRHNVLIELDLDTNSLLSTIDAVQIKQVIICLVLNAIESLADQCSGRRVEISTRKLPGNEIEVQVNDNGSGLNPELSDKVFEAFYTTKERGMGMGLAISRSIIENHSGRIVHRGRASGGASFIISLPLEHRTQS